MQQTRGWASSWSIEKVFLVAFPFGVGRTEPSARYDLTQTSPITSELRSLVDDLRVREVSYVLSPMYNVSVGAVDSSTPPVTPLLYPHRVVDLRAYSVLLDSTRPPH